MHQLIDYFTNNPKKLFIADATGAFLSGAVLYIISQCFNHLFNIPVVLFPVLLWIVLGFFLYSTCCALFATKNWRKLVLVICMLNLLYCLLTMVIAVIYYHTLSSIAIAYFVSEIIIIGLVVYIELGCLRKI